MAHLLAESFFPMRGHIHAWRIVRDTLVQLCLLLWLYCPVYTPLIKRSLRTFISLGFVTQILQYEIGLLRWILFSFWWKIVVMKYHTSCQQHIWWAPVKSIFSSTCTCMSLIHMQLKSKSSNFFNFLVPWQSCEGSSALEVSITLYMYLFSFHLWYFLIQCSCTALHV